MAKYKYSSKTENEHTAKAVGRDLGISIKHSVMICNFVRNKNLLKAEEMLKRVIEKKQAVPFTKFNFDRGHKKKIGPGRYPIKASKAILRVLENVESNAQSKGLNSSLLRIIHINSHKASIPKRYGRKGGVSGKRSHVEVIVEERAEEEKGKKTKTEKKKQEQKKVEKIEKKEEKKEVKKVEKKEEVKKEEKHNKEKKVENKTGEKS